MAAKTPNKIYYTSGIFPRGQFKFFILKCYIKCLMSDANLWISDQCLLGIKGMKEEKKK